MKILAISDQHGHLPEIPECDLLLVGGDLCPDTFGGMTARAFPDRQLSWFENEWMAWRHKQPAKRVALTWGNHDYCGNLLLNGQKDDDTFIVSDKELNIDGLRLWLTPWSNEFYYWAFMKPPKELEAIYKEIPEGIDILVSHQPPFGYGSQCIYWDPFTGKRKVEEVGSKELAEQLYRIKPKAVVCGHIHSGFGKYECNGIPIYNVSVVNEKYELVNKPTEIVLARTTRSNQE